MRVRRVYRDARGQGTTMYGTVVAHELCSWLVGGQGLRSKGDRMALPRPPRLTRSTSSRP
eukprot:3851479-Alexandrium_andersonii.AAC.1